MPTRSTELDFRKTTLSDALTAGLEDLVAAHSAEVELFQDRFGVQIHWPTYLAEERRGALHGIGVWCGDKLVGYAGFGLCRLPQRSNVLAAFNRGLYLSPEFRGHGADLVTHYERLARDCGAELLIQDVKEPNSTDAKLSVTLGKLLVRRGYAPYERLYAKVL